MGSGYESKRFGSATLEIFFYFVIDFRRFFNTPVIPPSRQLDIQLLILAYRISLCPYDAQSLPRFSRVKNVGDHRQVPAAEDGERCYVPALRLAGSPLPGAGGEGAGWAGGGGGSAPRHHRHAQEDLQLTATTGGRTGCRW